MQNIIDVAQCDCRFHYNGKERDANFPEKCVEVRLAKASKGHVGTYKDDLDSCHAHPEINSYSYKFPKKKNLEV